MAPGDNGAPPHPRVPDEVWTQTQELIRRLEASSVQRVAIDTGECKIEIERSLPGPPAWTAAAGVGQAAPLSGTPATGIGPGPGVAPEARAASGFFQALDGAALDRRIPVLAPLVGTFYRSSQPGAKPFVAEGDSVEAGETLCMVEAMKLFNEVVAHEPGRVVEFAVRDGERVEFDQVLMYLEPADD